MELTLNDFKALLGNVNDGNVVLTKDEKGLEKANHGNGISRLFHNYRQVTNDPEANKHVRNLLMTAILNSAEGKSLNERQISAIRQGLGIGNAKDEVLELSRLELKIALDTLEGMQRTNEIPTTGSDGTVTIPKRTAENEPKFGNRMVARQYEQIVSKGVLSDKDAGRLFDTVIGLFSKPGSPYRSVDEMVKLLPKTLHDHKQAEVAKFVRQNRALIESALVDNLAWKLIDGAANMPNKELFTMDVVPADVFLETVSDLMKTYGEHREPTPLAERLLDATGAAVREPVDAGEKLAFDAFKGELKAKLDALFPPQTPVTFASRQFERFRAHVEAALLKSYRDTYQQTAGAAVTRKEASDNRIQQMCPTLARYKGEELAAFAKKDPFVSMFVQAMTGRIAAMDNQGGRLAIADIAKAFDAAFASLDERMSLKPLAKACVAKMGLVGEQAERATAQLTADLDAAHSDMTRQLRSEMLGASLQGAESVENTAATLLDTYPDFKTFAAEKLRAFVDPDIVRKQRDELFAQAGESLAVNGEKTKADLYFEKYDKLVENLKRDWTLDKVPENEQQERLAQYEKLYKPLSEDRAFRGKLVVVVASGKIPPGSALLKRLVDRGKFVADPATIKENKEIVERLADELSLDELTSLTKYLRYNLETLQMTYQSVNAHCDPHTFLNVVSDGSIDFDAIPKEARMFIMTCVCSTYCLRETKDDFAIDIADSTASREALKLLYKEEREALLALLPKGIRAEDALHAWSLDEAELPDDYPVGRLCRLPGQEIEGVATNARLNQIEGFGTTDVHAILRALKGIGLEPKDLGTPENWMKMFRLQVLVRAHGGHLDGVVEWAERLTGKAFDDMRMVDCEKLFVAAENNETPVDPATTLEGKRLSVAAFLGGTVKMSEAKLVSNEMPQLLAALRRLSTGLSQGETVTFYGESVELKLRPNGELTAVLKGGKAPLPLSVSRSAAELVMQIENEMTTHVSVYGAGNVKAILPPVPQKGDPIARPRELYAKTLSSLLGLPQVNFAHLGTAELRAKTLAAFANPEAVKAEFSVPPQTYNNAEAVEMQEKFLLADPVERSRVTLPPVPPGRTLEQRRAEPPDAATVRDLVADLFMDKDTWAYDTGSRVPGQRLLTLLTTYAPEIWFLHQDPDLLNAVSPVMREAAKELLTALAAVDIKAPDALQKLAAIEENAIKVSVDRAMETIQAKVTDLFQGHAQAERPLWQQSLKEMSGSAGGIDTGTAEGLFLKKVLDNYFTKCDAVEKRAMLSAFIRNTDATSTDGRQVAEVLKGAGPLLQKMLQKLSPDMFDPETRLAIKDMKSKLAPIPDTVIQAQLLELVRTSRGQILSVEVKKSIGQASVGQALLCHIRSKEHPITGEDVVIKLLRPNVQTAVQREHALLLRLAAELDEANHTGTSQQKTFEGRYASILEEFDFTLESENIGLGQQAYERPTVTLKQDGERATVTYGNIHSMNRLATVDPCCGMLVLEKVDGEPVDRLLENTDEEVRNAVKDIKVTTQLPGGAPVTTYEARSLKELTATRFALRQKRDQLVGQRMCVRQMLDAWFERALFGDGVFHNDLHPGNVMMKGEELTVIDFGNVMRLSKKEQNELVFTFLSAMRGRPEDFLDSIGSLLDAAGAEKLKGMRNALAAELATIFSKGTSKDVLPRALAAMSVLQKRGLPIPDAVHNFAQSLARINGVIDAFDGEIRRIEQLSGEIRLSDEILAKYDDEHPEKAGFTVQLDIIREMNEIYRAQGDSVNGFDLNGLLQKAAALAERFKVNETEHTVSGSGVAPFRAEIQAKVFAQPDGGVAFLAAFREAFAQPVRGIFSTSAGVKTMKSVVPAGLNELKDLTEAYRKALAAVPRDPAVVAAAQEKVLQALVMGVATFAHHIGNEFTGLHVGTASAPVELVDFADLVGNSLGARGDALADVMRERKDIDKKKWDTVMEKLNNRENFFSILMSTGLDSGKFLALKNLVDELDDLDDKASAFARNVKDAVEAADADAAKLPVAERPSAELCKKLRASALDVRVPTGWKPSLADVHAKAQFREVLALALASAREAIAPAALTPNALAYFARVYVATSAPTGIPEFLAKPENKAAVETWIAELQLEAGQNAPDAVPQLDAFVAALSA